MDIERLELLFKKIEMTGKIISELKNIQKENQREISELKHEVEKLQKENTILNEDNQKWKEKYCNVELVHKNLENRIVTLLDLLPDFGEMGEDITSPGKKENEKVEKSSSDSFLSESLKTNFSEVKEESIFTQSGSKEATLKLENEFTLEGQKDQNILLEKGSLTLEKSEENLPYFETEEEPDYENMFAFDDIIDGSQESLEEDFTIRELPKGVL